MTILIRPIMTEKSMKLASNNEYTFEVRKYANTFQIAKEVADRFRVDVLSIKIINIHGKQKTQKRVRKFYQTSGFKKAIVRVKKGQTITIFETPKEEAVVTTAEEEPVVIKDKKDILRRTNVRVERGATGVTPTTQRKVITGK